MNINTPAQSAKSLLPIMTYIANEEKAKKLMASIKSHRLFTHPIADALKSGKFSREALHGLHVRTRYATIDGFIGLIMKAQVKAQEIEGSHGRQAVRIARFILALNLLDEMGFVPGTGEGGSERFQGNPLLAHPELFEELVGEFGIYKLIVPGKAAKALNFLFRGNPCTFHECLLLLVIAEESAMIHLPAMREAVRLLGIDVEHGYYKVHGSSQETETAFDDDHQKDAFAVLTSTANPLSFTRLGNFAKHVCDTWAEFLDEEYNQVD